jgi:hypothetical protein
MEGFKYASQFKLLPVPSVTVTDEEIEITQKCRQCGNEWSKELHCRECGNNFPFYPEDNNNIHFNSSIPDAQIETEARRMITEDPLRAYNLDFALSLARRVNKQYEK